MAYEKQTWSTGDLITAEKLNHLEEGTLQAGTLIVEVLESGDVKTLNKSFKEIYNAFKNGKNVVFLCFYDNQKTVRSYRFMSMFYSSKYIIYLYDDGNEDGRIKFMAFNEDDLPQYDNAGLL